MRRTRRKFGTEFKTKVALEALKERLTLAELAKKTSCTPSKVLYGSKKFIERSSLIFETKSSFKETKNKVNPDKLYRKIEQLEMEND